MLVAEDVQASDDLAGLLFSLVDFNQIRGDVIRKIGQQQGFESAVDHGQIGVDSPEAIQNGPWRPDRD